MNTQQREATQHTPGPWFVERDPLHFDSLSNVVGGEKRTKFGLSQELMVAVGGWANRKEQEANTRLIAAAPDLLQALCELLDLYDGRKHEGIAIVANARSAIAKATGGAA